MFRICFVNQGAEIEVAGGTLAEACDAAGYPLNLVCGGMGTCGKCRVVIEEDGEKKEVLACMTEVDRDLTVHLAEESISREATILTGSSAREEIRLAPALRKEYRTREDLYPDHCDAFFTGAGHRVMKKFSRFFNRKDCEGLTLVLSEGRLLDVQEGNTAGKLYGGAVDIGTTTVVLYVYDLTTGELLDTESELNAQIAHGADVVARILYSQEEDGALGELHRKIIGTINGLLSRAEGKVPGLLADLYHLVVCGNSTMQHLFLQLDPGALGVKPFANITADAVETDAAEQGLQLPDAARITFLPLLGGFVGADTTAVLLTLPEDAKKYLIIDLGTNGEIAVGNSERYLTSSTACGPALEGGNIECGMRGTDGAIEKVEIEGDAVRIRTIGGGEAKGLCGSGILDAVACMVANGLISKAGHLLSAEEFQKKISGERIVPVYQGDQRGEIRFLPFGESLYLSERHLPDPARKERHLFRMHHAACGIRDRGRRTGCPRAGGRLRQLHRRGQCAGDRSAPECPAREGAARWKRRGSGRADVPAGCEGDGALSGDPAGHGARGAGRQSDVHEGICEEHGIPAAEVSRLTRGNQGDGSSDRFL